jgi:hypothetical protein
MAESDNTSRPMTEAERRRERQAEALRENLRRRKAKAREQASDKGKPDSA